MRSCILLRRCLRSVRLKVKQPSAACTVLLSVLLVNSVCLYLLSTHPSPWVHTHGSFFPRRARDEGVWPCGPLGFAYPHAPVTALASVPGSGNTWLRHLLQQATGVLTGSMYNDSSLYVSGFPGEGVTNGSVLVVKTHSCDPEVRSHFRRAILLVRQPQAAILSEFHRQHGGHLGYAREEHFKEHWQTFVPEAASVWLIFNTEWLQFPGPLYVINYEDLRQNLNNTLANLLAFLDVTVDRSRLECALRRSKGKFKRRERDKSHLGTGSDMFTRDMRTLIEECEEKFHEELKKFYDRRTSVIDSGA